MDPTRSALRAVDDRRPEAIGRTGRLDLAFERRGARTVLAHAYAEPPLRVGASVDVEGAAYLILVCSGPGVFAGDALELSVHVGEGAHAILTSQAALQVHPSRSPSPAIIRHRYIVEAGGELIAHWDPAIPFAAARLDQRFDLDVQADGRLYWSDALMAGRVHRSEAWRFESLSQHLELRAGGSLKYLERYTVAPASDGVARPWVAAGHDYLASAIAYHERATAEAAESLQRAMDVEIDVGIRAGIDVVDPRLLIARLASSCGVSFAAARSRCQRFMMSSIFGRPTTPFRK